MLHCSDRQELRLDILSKFLIPEHGQQFKDTSSISSPNTLMWLLLNECVDGRKEHGLCLLRSILFHNVTGLIREPQASKNVPDRSVNDNQAFLMIYNFINHKLRAFTQLDISRWRLVICVKRLLSAASRVSIIHNELGGALANNILISTISSTTAGMFTDQVAQWEEFVKFELFPRRKESLRQLIRLNTCARFVAPNQFMFTSSKVPLICNSDRRRCSPGEVHCAEVRNGTAADQQLLDFQVHLSMADLGELEEVMCQLLLETRGSGQLTGLMGYKAHVVASQLADDGLSVDALDSAFGPPIVVRDGDIPSKNPGREGPVPHTIARLDSAYDLPLSFQNSCSPLFRHMQLRWPESRSHHSLDLKNYTNSLLYQMRLNNADVLERISRACSKSFCPFDIGPPCA